MSAPSLRSMAIAGGAALVLGCAGGAWWLVDTLTRPFPTAAGQAVDVILEPGLDASAVIRRLAARGVIRRPDTVRWWLAFRGGGQRLQAGEYRFEGPSTPLEVLRRVQAGDVLLHPVVVPEGLGRREVAERMSAAGFGSEVDLLAVFSDPTPVRDLDPQAEDLEGFLFPDTYHFSRGLTPRGVGLAMVRAFRDAIGPGYAEKAAALGLELREAVILASMIELETALPAERARVSRVFHNRLARGMRLECDPTVQYALERAGRPTKRLTRDHLRFESAWNTYVVRGLPRGPICNPGLASLRAAVEPLGGDEVYFVAAPDGGHRFSKDLASHLRAVAAWRAHVRSSR